VYLTGSSPQPADFTDASPRRGAWLWTLAKAALSLAVLGAACSRLNFTELAAPLGRANPLLLALAIAVLAGSIIAAALRWSLLTRPAQPIGAREANAITFAAQFVGQVLPSSLGQDAVRAWLAARGGRDSAQVISIILLDRLCGLIGLSALIFIGLPRLAMLGGAAHGREPALIAGGLALIALVAAFAARAIPSPMWLGPIATKIWSAGRDAVRRPTSIRGLIAILASIGVQALVVLSAWLIACALSVPLSLADGFATIPAAMFVALLPISLNGWGVREGAMIVSLGFAGVAASQAFLISILFGLGLLVTSLPGALTLVFLRRSP
jgi:uncharacterized membrane protein YbhN (UPF0104 family)